MAVSQETFADRRREMLDVELEGRPARHRAVDVAMVDAQVLGHRDRIVDHHPARAADADVPSSVDLSMPASARARCVACTWCWTPSRCGATG